MKTATALLSLSLITATAALIFTSTPAVWADEEAVTETEDIVYLNDGRVFHGHILTEDRKQLTFQYIDRSLNIKTKMTFSQTDIFKIERDQPLQTAAPASTGKSPIAATSRADDDEKSFIERLGSTVASDHPSLPGIYVCPMKGQMGTDIQVDIYEKVAEDIREQDPALVVWMLDCEDSNELMFSGTDRRESGMVDLDAYTDLVNALKDDLRGIPQVMWVKDSVGISSVMALAWSDMYMHPDARLSGLHQVFDRAKNWADDDVRAKMIAAWVAKANGFLENGGYPLALGEAMMNPEYVLSATWKGREVDWELHKHGEYIVDDSDERTVAFRAKTAEDFCISDGTAENLDDLMMLHGYREFRLIDANGPQMVEKYVEDWRRTFDNTKEYWADFEQHSGWASGEDALKYLGRAKGDLEKIVAAMDRYKAVEMRWRTDFRTTRFDLVTRIEQLKEQIRALRQGGSAGGAGGGGASGGGGRGRR